MDNLDAAAAASSTSPKSNAAADQGAPVSGLRTADGDMAGGGGAEKPKDGARTRSRHLTSRLRDITRMKCTTLLCSAFHYRTLRVAETNRSSLRSRRHLCPESPRDTGTDAWATQQQAAADVRANFEAAGRMLRRRAGKERPVKVTPVLQVLRGEKGVGKGHAARLFIHSTNSASDGGQPGHYSSVFWVHGSSQSSLTRSWRELAIALDILPAASLAPSAVFSRPLRNHLATTRSRWLLVIARVECLSLLAGRPEESLPVAGCCCDVLVLTSDMTGSLSPLVGDFRFAEGTAMQRWTHAEACDVVHRRLMPAPHSTSGSQSPPRSAGAADSGAARNRQLAADIAVIAQGNPRCVSMMCRCVVKASSLGVGVASQIRRCAASLEAAAAKRGGGGGGGGGPPSDAPGGDDLVPSPLVAVCGLALHCCLSPAAGDLLCIAAAMGGERVPLTLVLLLPSTLLPGDLRRALGANWHDVLCTGGEDSGGGGGGGGQAGSRALRRCAASLLRLVRELQVLELAAAVNCCRDGGKEEVEAMALSVSPAVRDAVLCCLPDASAGPGPGPGSLSRALECAAAMLLEADAACCWPSRRTLLHLQNEMLVPRLACRLAARPCSSGGGLQALSGAARHALCTLLHRYFYLSTPEDGTADDVQLACLLETLELVQLDESPAALCLRAALERCCHKLLSRQQQLGRALRAHQLILQVPRKAAYISFPLLLQYGAKHLAGRFRQHAGALAGLQRRPGNVAESLCIHPKSVIRGILNGMEDLIGTKHAQRMSNLCLDISAGFYLMLELLEKRISARRNGRTPDARSRQLADFQAGFDPLCHDVAQVLTAICQGNPNDAHRMTLINTNARGGLAEHALSQTSSSAKTSGRQQHAQHQVHRSSAIGMKLARFSHDSLMCTGVTRVGLAMASLIILHAVAQLADGRHTDFHREVERARCVKQHSCRSTSLQMDGFLQLMSVLEMSCGKSLPSVIACDLLD